MPAINDESVAAWLDDDGAKARIVYKLAAGLAARQLAEEEFIQQRAEIKQKAIGRLRAANARLRAAGILLGKAADPDYAQLTRRIEALRAKLVTVTADSKQAGLEVRLRQAGINLKAGK